MKAWPAYQSSLGVRLNFVQGCMEVAEHRAKTVVFQVSNDISGNPMRYCVALRV